MNNIVLIGMPSCGKSTVGVLLAKHLGYRFIDSDLLIQEHTGKLLHELIAERGMQGFLALENEINAGICAQRSVISTGGSVIYGREAMEHLRSIGTVIYLKIGFQTLTERLGDYVHRGVVMPAGYTLRDMYDERAKLYETYADLVVDEEEHPKAGGDTLGETLEKCLKVCKKVLTK
ncbi:MAG: shikimate kinase [Clostridia bacterium]|nr:shikimate kinase [Clostridia bacterium]